MDADDWWPMPDSEAEEEPPLMSPMEEMEDRADMGLSRRRGGMGRLFCAAVASAPECWLR